MVPHDPADQEGYEVFDWDVKISCKNWVITAEIRALDEDGNIYDLNGDKTVASWINAKQERQKNQYPYWYWHFEDFSKPVQVTFENGEASFKVDWQRNGWTLVDYWVMIDGERYNH